MSTDQARRDRSAGRAIPHVTVSKPRPPRPDAYARGRPGWTAGGQAAAGVSETMMQGAPSEMPVSTAMARPSA
ncbi:hypothetical protein Cch02nite_04980 [Catellatospora chokoriensis]|uniref:Uncharacterized protein n=1 Tax=Catellatospora chokoriensis TaxID=310353 RepID=A0A8J3K1Z3_9ACTN|nr:hypothetical protein Cch02nite_04980 [Catellatospora chokoriensis]